MGLFLIAQAEGSGIPGGAGWVGTGLLGSVLAWLLFVRMPAWDKLMQAKDEQIQKMIATRDNLFQAIANEHDKATAAADTERRQDYIESLKTVVGHCSRELDTMREMMQKDMSEMTAAIVDLRRVMEEVRESYIHRQRATP